jgi:hypothetical protein
MRKMECSVVSPSLAKVSQLALELHFKASAPLYLCSCCIDKLCVSCFPSRVLLLPCLSSNFKDYRFPSSMMFHIRLLPSRWGAIPVLALYPPQHHQTCWILSTYTHLESISSQLCCCINHSFICFCYIPRVEAQKWICKAVATPHQIRFWSEHD